MADEHSTGFRSSLGDPPQFEQLIHDEERRFINARCEFDTSPVEVPASGQLKLLKGRVKQRAGHFVVAVLERYFADQQEFTAHLVRLQNKLTANHDRMADEIRALHQTLRIEFERLRRSNSVLHVRLEERLAALEREVRGTSSSPTG